MAESSEGEGSRLLGGRSDEQLTTRAVLSARLEKLHLMTRHQRAMFEIAGVIKGGGSQLQIREVVFKQAIGALNRHLLGKELLTGLQIYDDLLVVRCKAGADGNMDAVMGKFMGQQLVKDMSDAAGFTLEGSKFVSAFLSAKLDEVNVEQEVLNKITLFRSGGAVGIPSVAHSERYLDYLLVDRMIKDVSSIFEAFGLGSSNDVFSWASIMEEVKAQLIGVSGLA